MGFTNRDSKIEIWISFSSFIRSGIVLPQEKCSALTLLSWWGLELFETRKIWFSFSSFIRSGSVLPQEKCSAMTLLSGDPVSWEYRIHWLCLCRGVRLLEHVSWILHKTIECWSFGECGVPLHCHRSQVHSDLEWYHLIGFYLWVS